MENSLSKEFLEVTHELKKLIGMHHSRYSLHPGEIMMLSTINKLIDNNRRNQANDNLDNLGVKVGELSKNVFTTKSATSKMLKSVEDKGYIERVVDSKDRRVVYVRLTTAGESIIKETLESMGAFMDSTIQKLGEEDSQDLIRLMRKFKEAMIQVIQEEENVD